MSAPRPDTAATQPMSTTSRCRHAAVGLRRSVLAALRGTERGIEETAISRASAGAAPPDPIAMRLAGARAPGPPASLRSSVGGPTGVVDVAGYRLGEGSSGSHRGRVCRIGEGLEHAPDHRGGGGRAEAGLFEYGDADELRRIRRRHPDEQRGVLLALDL